MRTNPFKLKAFIIEQVDSSCEDQDENCDLKMNKKSSYLKINEDDEVSLEVMSESSMSQFESECDERIFQENEDSLRHFMDYDESSTKSSDEEEYSIWLSMCPDFQVHF